jgi:PAS domain S-box-containing protein
MEEFVEAALRARIAALEAELASARESASVLDGVLAAVPAIVMRVDASFRMRDISRVVGGKSYDEVVDTQFFDHVPEPERAKIMAIYRRVLAGGPPEHYQTVGEGPDGRTSAYDSYVARTDDGDGVHGLVVVAIDVTERLERERAFVASEESGRLAVEATGIGLWSLDLATNVVTWNDAMHRICGVDTPLGPEAFTQKLAHPDDVARIRANTESIKLQDRFQDSPARIIRPDGETRWVLTTGRLLRDTRGTPTQLIGTTLDVTSERLLDERLRQSQRLEAVGQLSAGVAHNFNNILASIMPVLDLVAPHTPERFRGLVEGASHSARRAAELVRQLMTFAGQRASASRRVEPIASLTDRAITLCRHLLDASITLTVEDTSRGARVRCDSGAIEQAIVNLVLNARDAIDETGRGNGTIRITVGSAPSGHDVFVRVIDDGVGMDDQVSRRIFEPFFTTKEVGRGTGLGLPVTYATVRDHGGTLVCKSTRGAGSTFEVVLPIEMSESATEPEARVSEPPMPHGRKVLVVDDDQAVLAALSALLTELGHALVIATSAFEAVALAAAQRDIGLVLLDRAMPGQIGDAIVPSLREHLPGVPIVFFTGDDVDDEARQKVFDVLPKPASRRELVALLSRIEAASVG